MAHKCINTWDLINQVDIGGISDGFWFIKQKDFVFGKMVIG